MPDELLPARLQHWVEEAVHLRSLACLPAPSSGPGELLESLSSTRQALDRVEAILLNLVQAKARAERQHTAADAEAEDAWDRAAQQSQKSGVARDFTGPRERYADFNLSALAQRRQARQAAELLSMVSEAYEVVRTCHRGLDSLRLDHHRVLGAFAMESSLER